MTPILSSKRTGLAAAAFAITLLAGCGGDGGMATAPAASSPGTGTGTSAGYTATALVSDVASGAAHVDANLVNAWGLAFNPSGYVWVANANTSTSTLYDGNGVAQSLVVAIQPGAVGNGNPSGIVYNGTSDFAIANGTATGPAPFIFATLEGQIASWAPGVDGTHALTQVDDGAAGASYTGLAIGTSGAVNLLYAADFGDAAVAVFDGSYTPVATAGGFVDPTLPAGYAPFGIQQIGGKIYVTYAQKDPTTQRDVHGAGLGLVDVFDTQGTLLTHLVPAGGALNAPWGLALAPSGFGEFAGMLLVGNFGDGRINAYDPATGAFKGTISDNAGTPIVIDGLWGLAFGNDLLSQPSTTLFFTAGPAGETHGLYGRVDVN